MNSNADVQANDGESDREQQKKEGDDKTKTRCIAVSATPSHIMTHKIHRRLRNDQQTLQAGATSRRKRPQLDLWVN